ncbi:MAG: 23S rRNA (pseudouridine(1915)-N(3))-methyltransferase RlmH [Pseudomonadota bacterium]
MRLFFATVGRMKSGPEKELFERYCKRIAASGKSKHLFGPELIEIAEGNGSSAQERSSQEARQLIQKLPDHARLILLDETGKSRSSKAFAALIESEQLNGTEILAFVIGGPDGHGEEIRNLAFDSLQFGSLTWPHQLARVMLSEQVYRAITILAGHPYHRQ